MKQQDLQRYVAEIQAGKRRSAMRVWSDVKYFRPRPGGGEPLERVLSEYIPPIGGQAEQGDAVGTSELTMRRSPDGEYRYRGLSYGSVWLFLSAEPLGFDQDPTIRYRGPDVDVAADGFPGATTFQFSLSDGGTAAFAVAWFDVGGLPALQPESRSLVTLRAWSADWSVERRLDITHVLSGIVPDNGHPGQVAD